MTSRELPLRVLSLFAGIGGIDLGLEAHGCKTVAYSEVDPYACRVMARHFPDAINLGDITTIDWEATRELGIDIICGGFPCQDISLAGNRAGIADGTRSGLWRHYADAIRVLRPRGVLVENVAALASSGLDRVLGDLAACGYDAEWDCIPAAAVSAPHLRDRLFIVAYRTDAAGCGADASSARREGRGRSAADGGDVRRPGDPRRVQAGTSAIAGGHGGAVAAADTDAGGRGTTVGDVRPGESDSARRGTRADADARRQRGAEGADHGQHQSAGHARREVQRGRSPFDQWPRPEGSDYWLAEPDVGRMGHGIPDRVDRLRCLGNAVVPHVAEHVAGILLDRMEAA